MKAVLSSKYMTWILGIASIAMVSALFISKNTVAESIENYDEPRLEQANEDILEDSVDADSTEEMDKKVSQNEEYIDTKEETLEQESIEYEGLEEGNYEKEEKSEGAHNEGTEEQDESGYTY